MGSTRRSFTDEYKEESVAFVIDGGLARSPRSPRGLRTCSASECSSTESITQVRWKPVTTAIRRDTVEGLSRRISCIHLAYSSTWTRPVVNGAHSRSEHQVKNSRRSGSECTREVPVNRPR